ncbi:TetR/AcrR family transcriptional regulator [Glaciecola sp. MH2013]|uniref:TetR/AcrR family transcriptional regulator n=1 Tax=Glaciecola sp. MH2013 TaxID=2785524 RepID=UPI00189D98F6|nr:TetR/AcrR family transcriptional regulator [Glaciecola sp. MH2013]MBF7073750.1 TetR/AcrR family transcriptional regulator [Glaciecola sp. MH2013]
MSRTDCEISNGTKSAGRPKSAEKRSSILCTASELFLRLGYDRTSMDAVAKSSGVSKQTVYSHFKNKDILYTSVIEQKCNEYRIEEDAICIETQGIEDLLNSIARNFVALLTDKSVIAMYSVVIGESKNNKRVAQLFYEAGPAHGNRLVRKLLASHPSTQLNSEEAKEVATDFFNLLKGEYHMQSMLRLPFESSPEKLAQFTQRVVHKTMMLINMHKK